MKNLVRKETSKRLLSMLMLLLMLFTFAACKEETITSEEESKIWEEGEHPSESVLGEGEKSFNFKVTVGEKSEEFVINTDEMYVGDALEELSLISGDEGEYGLYVKYVNGIRADYETDGAYWAFYINDEMAMTGVDMTEIEDGALYEMRYTKQ